MIGQMLTENWCKREPYELGASSAPRTWSRWGTPIRRASLNPDAREARELMGQCEQDAAPDDGVADIESGT